MEITVVQLNKIRGYFKSCGVWYSPEGYFLMLRSSDPRRLEKWTRLTVIG